VTNFDFTTASYEENGEGYLLTRGTMQWFWAHYPEVPPCRSVLISAYLS
jgi:hypothetical protein